MSLSLCFLGFKENIFVLMFFPSLRLCLFVGMLLFCFCVFCLFRRTLGSFLPYIPRPPKEGFLEVFLIHKSNQTTFLWVLV